MPQALQSLLALKLKLYKDLAGQQKKEDAANIGAFDTMEIGGAVRQRSPRVCSHACGCERRCHWLTCTAARTPLPPQNVMTIDQTGYD